MKRILLLISFVVLVFSSKAQHNPGHNGKVLMIVSNPTTSEQTGWPIGVWASELTHPYWEFSDAGYAIDIASPLGGEVKIDAFSDPEDESGYSAFDYISLGFLKDPEKSSLLKSTLKLSEVNPNNYKAIFVCGGQGPMYTFYDNTELHKFFADFYETGKPTAAICHGTNILLKTKLSNGEYLVKDKKWTGFANSEEQYADNYVGYQIQPFRIEDEAQKMPKTNFVTGEPFSPFALRDDNLITGQQQNSGAAAARLVIEALEEDKNRYPTYILVHGAWADESAWGFVRNQLAVEANVEVVNLPGHGIELTPASDVSLDDYVSTVVKAMDKYQGEIILVGHSMAGIVLSTIADNYPEKVDKLVYVSAYVPQNGESVVSLAEKDEQSKVGINLEYTKDYSAATIKKEIIPEAVCSDCPDYMKEVLVKYHKAEPTAPLNRKVELKHSSSQKVPTYYIHTKKDAAVGYNLQKEMVKNIKDVKTYTMKTSHLSFVVNPEKFISILAEIKADTKQSKSNKIKSKKVGDINVHTYFNKDLVSISTHILELPKSLVIIDSQLTYMETKEILEFAETLNKPISRVIITHAHPDHFLGTYAFSDYKVYAHREVSKAIKDNGEAARQVFLSNFGPDMAAPEILAPQYELENNFSVDGIKFEVNTFRDNEADVASTITIPSRKIFISGDLLYNKTHLFPGNNHFENWKQQLKTLGFPDNMVILPGHGEVCTPAVINENIAYLKKAIAISKKTNNVEEYKAEMTKAYPDYKSTVLIDFGGAALFQE